MTRRTAIALGAIVLCTAGAAAGGAGATPAAVDQTIVVTVHAPATATYDTAFAVAATSTSSLPVTFSAAGTCTNSGDTFEMTSGTGTCQVKFDQAGNGTYNPAPQVVDTVTAQKANQTIVFGPIAEAIFGEADFDIVGAFATSELALTFTAVGNCTVTGANIHVTGAGSCTVTASQPGNANYNPAPQASQTFAIAKSDQTITFDPLPDRVFSEPDFTVRAGADSGLRVLFTASGQCRVRVARVHLTAPGSCTITAAQPGNVNFDPAPSVSQSFTIARAACFVPRVVGKRLLGAKRALARGHCRTGRVTYALSRKVAKGRVISQSRKPFLTLRPNTRINLVVSLGRR